MSYKNMNHLAEDIKQLIDNYWKLEMSEAKIITEVSYIFSDTVNRGLIMRGLCFKAGFERKLGKKRIEEIKRILVKVDKELYEGLV